MPRIIRCFGTIAAPFRSAAFSFDFSISADTQDYSLYDELVAAGWNESDPVDGTVTVESGVYVGASGTSSNAFVVSGLPAESSAKLINYGTITGAGGAGGGAEAGSHVDPGYDGGTGLRVESPLTVDNGSGQINGGAGGGGAGSATYYDGANFYTAAAGGGGGAGYVSGSGGTASGASSNDNGSSGSKTSGGAGGDASAAGADAHGGDGGAPGSDGGSSSAGGNYSTTTRSGGSVGNAIEGTSNITWESGSGNVSGPTTT